MNSIYSVLDLLTFEIKSSILQNHLLISYITEIRIRLNKPVIVYITDEPNFIGRNGEYLSVPASDCLVTHSEEFEAIINKLCNNSFHTNIETLKKGYIITKSGIRIGVCSKAVYNKGQLTSVKDITSINIRIPHEYKNCARQILNEIYRDSLPSIIVAALPSMGKTTFLRDLSRLVSSGYYGKYRKVSIIDERSEIAGDFDVGINTDVISNYPKADGIEMAIRTMSPEIIVCDEIGTVEELNKIKFGFSSGVHFAVSVHTDSVESIREDSILFNLIQCHCFDYLIILEHYTEAYKIYDLKGDTSENSRNFNDNGLLGLIGNFFE